MAVVMPEGHDTFFAATASATRSPRHLIVSESKFPPKLNSKLDASNQRKPKGKEKQPIKYMRSHKMSFFNENIKTKFHDVRPARSRV